MYASCHHANQKTYQLGIYYRLGCYLLACALVSEVCIVQIKSMDHNLEDIDFEDPLDGSLLDVSVQEEIVEQYIFGISSAVFFCLLKSNLKRHLIFHCKCTQYFTSQIALTSQQNAKHNAKHQLHACTSCDKSFFGKSHLNAHQGRFHELGPLGHSYQCHFEACNKTYQKHVIFCTPDKDV